MKTVKTILMFATIVMLAGPALADWDPGDPYKMHFPQLPDLDHGVNVEATSPTVFESKHVLADDFLCTQTGPITDIHIWGSWLEDEYPDGGRGFPDPANVHFRLSIHSDIPASQSPTGYSMPGEPLWMDSIDGRNWRLWAESDEEFFAPNTVGIMGTDTQVIQYNFSDFEEPFEQERDTIYWLSVTAFPENMPNGGQPPTTYFGWKSSDMHWNDQAVFWVERSDGTSTTPQELIGPTGKSLDLAFVITPEPATMSLLALGGVAMLRRRRRRKIA